MKEGRKDAASVCTRNSLFLFFDYNQTTIANSLVAALEKSMEKGKFANANHGDKASNTIIPFSGWGQSLQGQTTYLLEHAGNEAALPVLRER
jgi:hypothetical protein